MWMVYNEFGPVADFETRIDAQVLCDRENEDEPGSHWILFVYHI